jgi:hypothetical protein
MVSAMALLLVGTENGLHALDRPEGSPELELEGHQVTTLATEGDARWALADRRQVWRAAPSRPWSQVAELPARRGNCLCPPSSALLVGTSEAHLQRLRDGVLEPVESFDQVEGREDWYTPWGGPPDVRSISRGEDGSIYANVHVGGIVRSRDDGASWEPTIDIHSDVHQVLAPQGHGGLVVAACARGLVGSDDGGDTWIFETEGLHSTYCRAVAVGADTVYLSASAGPRGGRAALYRIPIAGGSFEKCADGLPEWFSGNIDTFCVAASGSQVAFGTEDGSVFASTDAGRTWEAWAEGLPPVRCVAFG